MKIILVDDEPVMHLIMRKMLAKYPEVQVVGAFTDTLTAETFLSANVDIGLAFVDISMAGESGMSFAARMDEVSRSLQIVFVTSHKEFALEAYDLSVTDYLVKPVSQERLERTINRALAVRESTRAHLLKPADAKGNREILITTLGDFSVQNEEGRVKWISSKSAELFAYLLLNRGKRIARSRLVTDIFGGMSRDSAEKYLNTTVYQLRKSLEPLGLREVVRSENDGYVLELSHTVIDFEEFEQKAGKLERIDSSDVEDVLQVERLYTGDLFGNKSYVWAIYEAERFAVMYASFVKRVSEELITHRSTTIALKLLYKLYSRNPLDESILRMLMKIHGLDGNKKALTAQYTDYVKLLSRELGIRPSKELILQYDSLVNNLSTTKDA
ncbi:response regulator [Cohnella sp. WQ 127256]|uniref:response regulator n=1 Tax=Cohnella sp. WQ 127256 TaxID=2938790 RepID=UPI00211811F0|nr:response regulator [Cohnella sp. WQ 127256]